MPACFNILSWPTGDLLLERIAARVQTFHPVRDLDGVGRVLADAVAAPWTALDLIGHSSEQDGSQLRLGDTLLTATDAAVRRFFAGHRDRFAALGIRALRLLGCETAAHDIGRATLGELARLSGLSVFGAIVPLAHANYAAGGFAPRYEVYLRDQSGQAPSQYGVLGDE